jgi:glycosyltransferase involved in cell wall biosynthesis
MHLAAVGNGHRKLRIAQVAPLHEAVPPLRYGGTERVVSYLTEELVASGHDVTLFASGDSQTAARLVPMVPHALRETDVRDSLAPHVVMLETVYRRLDSFDLVHFHCDYLHFPASRRLSLHHVTTLHGRLDLPETVQLLRAFPDMPLVSISESQRSPIPEASWEGTVHHGIPSDLYHLDEHPGDYLAFVGRISPEKRLDLAIEIARRVGLPLRVAAKVDRADSIYYHDVIRPLLHPGVELVGEIGDREKQEFLGKARALVFPIDWPEPFGLVMIEAMACGTPVIAFRRGSVPEVIDDGVTGYICDDVDQAVHAIERLPSLSRAGCRRTFERRFTATRMADDYLWIYRQLIARPHDGSIADAAGLLHPGNERARG